MRRDDDARSNPSFSWLIFCFSFCSDALSVMLIWKHRQYSVQIIIFGRSVHNNVIHCKYEGSSVPLRGCPRFSAAWSVHEYFLLFPGPSDMLHHSSVTYCSIEWIKGNLNDIAKHETETGKTILHSGRKKKTSKTQKFLSGRRNNYWLLTFSQTQCCHIDLNDNRLHCGAASSHFL